MVQRAIRALLAAALVACLPVPAIAQQDVGGAISIVATALPPSGAAGGVLSGTYPNPGFASTATNTVLGNATSGSAAPTALAVGTCSTAGSALIWTTNTGFGCNTSITAAVVPLTGVTGLGTGIATALAVNAGSAGAPVLFNGAGGTPSSLALASATGLPLTTGVTGILPGANGGEGVANTGTTFTRAGNVTFSGAFGFTGTLTATTAVTFPTSGTLATTAATVASFSGGTTGLTPNSATTGAVTLAGTLVAANGGSGFASYAVGDLLYADTTTTLAKLADIATTNVLLSGGVGAAPSWGKVALGALATQATNTIVANATSGTTVPTALAIGSCSAATSALTWTTNSGFGCNTLSSTYLPLAGGTMTGGIGFSTTNTLDIGTSATVLAPRTVYAGTSFVGPVGTFTTSATMGAGSAITSSGPGGALTSAAFTSIGTSGATVPLLSTANTWTLGQTFSAPLLAADGSSSAPSHSFSAETGTGFYRSAANKMVYATNAHLVMMFGDQIFRVNGNTAIGWTSSGADPTGAQGTGLGNPSTGLITADGATFGGGTASFGATKFIGGASFGVGVPMWKASGASWNARLGNDSADTGIIASTATLSAVANAATTSALCYNTGTGVITYNSTVGTCTVSTKSAKDNIIPMSPEEGYTMVMGMNPVRYTLKKGLPTYMPGEQIGLIAEEAYKVDPRMVAMNDDGSTAGFRYEQYTAALTAAFKYLKADNDNLHVELDAMKKSKQK